MRGSLPVEPGAGKKLVVAWHFSRAGGWTDPRFECSECQSRGLHLRRNCRRFFPDRVVPGRIAWVRTIEAATPDRAESRRVLESAVDDCPVSFVTAETIGLLETVQIGRIALKREVNASLFGTDCGKWPARYWDAWLAIDAAEAAELELTRACQTRQAPTPSS